MDEYICSKCFKNIFKEKISLVDKMGRELLFCEKCYNEITKEDKLELMIPKNLKINVFLDGYAYQKEDASVMPLIWIYNLSLKEINKFSITNYNRHFLLCNVYMSVKIVQDMAKQLEDKKRNEIAKQYFFKEYELLDKKEKKLVKKELGALLMGNAKRNKIMGMGFKDFLEKEIAKG